MILLRVPVLGTSFSLLPDCPLQIHFRVDALCPYWCFLCVFSNSWFYQNLYHQTASLVYVYPDVRSCLKPVALPIKLDAYLVSYRHGTEICKFKKCGKRKKERNVFAQRPSDVSVNIPVHRSF